MLCAHCGAPIKYNRFAHGYLHEEPLGEFRLSRREADDVHRDPPRYREPLHRPTVIHPAEPARR